MRFLAVVLFVSLCACVSAPCQQGWTLSATTPSFFSTTYAYESFGVLMNTNDGKVINFYRDGTAHAAGGVASMRVSTTARLAVNPNDWDFYSGTRFGSGASCTFNGCFYADATLQVQNMNGNCDATTCVVLFDEDDGTHCCSNGALLQVSTCAQPCSASGTWSTPVTISNFFTPTNENLVVIPSGVSATYPGGVMLEVALDGSVNCNLLQSTSHGNTWTLQGAIAGCANTEELGLAYYATGDSLVGFLRPQQGTTPGSAPMILFYTANNFGAWSHVNTNIDISSKPCCDSNGIPFGGVLTSYQILSPWILNQNLSDGTWTVIFGERQTWNSSISTNFGWIRAIHFKPATAIASPTGFNYGQVLDFRNIDSSVSDGYPSAAQTTDSNHLIIQFNTEKAFAQAVQLFTLSSGYACGGSFGCAIGMGWSGGSKVQ